MYCFGFGFIMCCPSAFVSVLGFSFVFFSGASHFFVYVFLAFGVSVVVVLLSVIMLSVFCF